MERAPEDLYMKESCTLIEADSAPLTEHKPLISKRGWAGIALGILSLCVMVLLPPSFFEQLTHNPVTGIQWFHFFHWEEIPIPSVFKNNPHRDHGFRYFWIAPHLVDEATSQPYL